MNVTLILGNGFDLNMGLLTSYSDFYKYYLQVDSPKSTNLIKQEIGEKPRNWADFVFILCLCWSTYRKQGWQD